MKTFPATPAWVWDVATVEWDHEKAKALAEALRNPDSPQSQELQVRVERHVRENQQLVDSILDGERLSELDLMFRVNTR